MKIELNEQEQLIAEKIVKSLVGLSYERAKEIVKAVLINLKSRAVIEGD